MFLHVCRYEPSGPSQGEAKAAPAPNTTIATVIKLSLVRKRIVILLLSNSFEAHLPRTWQPVFFWCWVLYQENPEFPKKIPAALASVFFHTFLNN